MKSRLSRTMGYLAIAGALSCGFASAGEPATDCHTGFYRLRDSRGVDIAPSSGSTLRWRMLDGTSGALSSQIDQDWQSTLGWTGRPDGHRVSFANCAGGTIQFDGIPAKRVDFETREVTFDSGGIALAGRLVMPTGNAPVPLVVLVHGSEDSSARETYTLQRLFPAQGVAAFVYDKRGTGASRGTFTHDYHVLAADAAAAVREAQRLAGARVHRVGFQGSSQGGWVAPLAATLTRVDFVIVGYGLAVSPLDEDREAVALDMTRHGFGAEETRKALEVAKAAHAIIYSEFRSGYDELDALRARYSGEAWFPFLRGNVTQFLLSEPHDMLRARGPVMFAGILPDYDPMPVLRTLDTPQLWILGGEDIDAPSGETLRRLRALKEDGRPISTVVYPHAEHGMYEFETDATGERLSTRQPPGYLALMSEFAKRGKIGRRYGDAAVFR